MTIAALLEALMVAIALSIDTFVAGFAYGANKIKIPFLSAQIINLICSSILGISLLAGHLIRLYIPPAITSIICFGILFCLGLGKLTSSLIKSFVRKHAGLQKELKFSFLNLNFILQLCANPEKADVDASKVISATEAISLALALSLDGIAVGFGAALAQVSPLLVFLCSLVTDFMGIISGCFTGRKLVEKVRLNLSWLSGALLIILAIMKLTF